MNLPRGRHLRDSLDVCGIYRTYLAAVFHGYIFTTPVVSLSALAASTFTGSGLFLSRAGLPKVTLTACSSWSIRVRRAWSPASKLLRIAVLAIIAGTHPEPGLNGARAP